MNPAEDRDPVGSLTLPQVEAVAKALGLDVTRLTLSLLDARAEGRVQ